jgi:hypothetical protein
MVGTGDGLSRSKQSRMRKLAVASKFRDAATERKLAHAALIGGAYGWP